MACFTWPMATGVIIAPYVYGSFTTNSNRESLRYDVTTIRNLFYLNDPQPDVRYVSYKAELYIYI